MTEHHFVKVLIEKTDDGNYRIMGLPEGRNFRKEESYVELTASWLKVNGVGFACNGAEFSEHDTIITVRQKTSGGSAYIEWSE